MSRRRNTENSNEQENVIPNNETENTSEVNTETTEPIEENKEIGLEAKEVVMDEPVTPEEVTAGLAQVVPGSEKKFEVGAKVKIHKDVGTDIVGKRIHNGIKNYTYTIQAVRPDSFLTIGCMAYQFTVARKDVDLV